MYTREEFEAMRRGKASEMSRDESLRAKALDVLVEADRYNWIHQTTWMGEPILNLPQDMFAVQEILYQTRPKFIVEVGVAWGGALLFYSTLMEVLGGDGIIGIDLYVPNDLKERIRAHGRIAERIAWIEESSLHPRTFSRVKEIIGDSREVLVLLDSFHTHDHVLKELQLYSSLVGKGHYLICGDTILEDIPVQEHRPRPWGPGNNPKTALVQFLKENDRFEVDFPMSNKLLLTCHPGGYLKCIKE
jgi:cephalosporin hydroxylase